MRAGKVGRASRLPGLYAMFTRCASLPPCFQTWRMFAGETHVRRRDARATLSSAWIWELHQDAPERRLFGRSPCLKKR